MGTASRPHLSWSSSHSCAREERPAHKKNPGLSRFFSFLEFSVIYWIRKVKCLELEEVLCEQGYNDVEVAEKVQAYRKMLLGVENDKKAFHDVDEFGRPVIKDSHQLAQAQKEKNDKLKAAFGLSGTFIDGSSFERNRAAKEKAEEVLASKKEDKKPKKKKKKRARSSSSSSTSSSSSSSSSSEEDSSESAKAGKKKKKKKKKKSSKKRSDNKRGGSSAEREEHSNKKMRASKSKRSTS